MPKSKKRTVTCGKCKQEGHNARTCTTVAEAPKTAAIKGPVTTSEVVLPDPPKSDDTAAKNERPRREAPTADTGTASTAAPYQCPKCNQVKILAIVRVKDHLESNRRGHTVYKGETRCELCLNKPDPVELILVWGAKPDQKLTPAEANA